MKTIDGKTYIEANVVMLASEDEPTNGLQPISVYSKPITRGGIICPLSGAEARRLVKMRHQAYHLYITTDEEIKEGDDICMPGIPSMYSNVQDRPRGRAFKIVASTNPKYNELGVHKIPQYFIEEYCKAGGIDKVLVEVEPFRKLEWEDIMEKQHYKIKLNPDNTINIRHVKEKMYSRSEMFRAFSYGFQNQEGLLEQDLVNILIDRFNKWIEQNL